MGLLSIERKAAFNFIRYASVWEDADILCEALAPVAKDGRLLSIASSGDNVLALLTTDPKEVVAVDLNSAQLACLELRIAAFRELEERPLLGFLGVVASDARLDIYKSLRKKISPSAAEFWDKYPEAVQQGIIHAGKFERYLRLFGSKVLPWVHRSKVREGLLKLGTPLEQRRYYHEKWDTWLWRLLFKVFFSRRFMGWMGRDPAFFDHVEGEVSEHILSRTKYAMTEMPAKSNPFLTYIIGGNYRLEALPRYLRHEYIPMIRQRLDRIKIVKGGIEDACIGQFDGFNLSDIFEYMSVEEHLACYGKLVEHANPKARLAYWNMRVFRGCPASFKGKVRHLEKLSEELHANDKAWFYRAFHVDEVT